MRSKMLVIGAMVFMLAFASGVFAKEKPAAQLLPPDTVIGGKTLSEWHVAWWQWADSMSNAESPVTQQGGKVDTSNQPDGPVWFLAGYFGDWFTPQGPVTFTRRIWIPEGKALFFPILNGELTPAEYEVYVEDALEKGDPVLTPLEYLESWFTPEDAVLAMMSATIDGVPVTNIGSYRAPALEPYSTWLPAEDNHLETYYPDGGAVSPVIADGWGLLVAPLSLGKHTINFKATLGENLGMDITYIIQVQKATKKNKY